MSRQNQTGRKNRTTYVYYTADGSRVSIMPGEDGVTEADIALLHSWDDADVNQQRRIDYRTAYPDPVHDSNEATPDDYCSHLADDTTNPETILIAEGDRMTHQEKLATLAAAMESLLPRQLELFQKVYIHRRSLTDIAAEEGVTEAAIRNRLHKIHRRLRKSFPD